MARRQLRHGLLHGKSIPALIAFSAGPQLLVLPVLRHFLSCCSRLGVVPRLSLPDAPTPRTRTCSRGPQDGRVNLKPVASGHSHSGIALAAAMRRATKQIQETLRKRRFGAWRTGWAAKSDVQRGRSGIEAEPPALTGEQENLAVWIDTLDGASEINTFHSRQDNICDDEVRGS